MFVIMYVIELYACSNERFYSVSFYSFFAGNFVYYINILRIAFVRIYFIDYVVYRLFVLVIDFICFVVVSRCMFVLSKGTKVCNSLKVGTRSKCLLHND